MPAGESPPAAKGIKTGRGFPTRSPSGLTDRSRSTTRSFLSDSRGGLRQRLTTMADRLRSTDKADSPSIALMKKFCECTSAHGFHKIFQTASLLHRAVWLLIIVTAVTGFSLHLFFLISRFFQAPVNTETRVYSTKFVFPDVTICSTSHFSRIRFDRNPRVPSTNATIKEMIDRIRRFWDPGSGNQKSSAVNSDLRNSLKSYLHEVNVTKQPQDLIMHCHYAGAICSYRDFIEYVDPEYFSCYTLVPPSRHLIVGGEKDGGLMLVLYAGDSHNFITEEESLSYSKGFRVIIHEGGTRPNMMEGFYIQQGANTYVQLSYTKETVLSKESRPCIPENSLPQISFVDRYGKTRLYKYTITDCSMYRYQDYLNKTCHCLSEMLPLPVVYQTEFADFRTKFCHRIPQIGDNTSATDSVQNRRDCHDKAVQTIHKLTAADMLNCSISCNNLQYDMRLTQNAWPSDSGEAMQALLKSVARTEDIARQDSRDLSVLHEIQNLLTNDSNATHNFVKLNVYSHSTMGNMVVENWAYPARNLFSDIGGILGLWLGVSIISTFEFIELFFHLIKSWSSAKADNSQRRRRDSASEDRLEQVETNYHSSV